MKPCVQQQTTWYPNSDRTPASTTPKPNAYAPDNAHKACPATSAAAPSTTRHTTTSGSPSNSTTSGRSPTAYPPTTPTTPAAPTEGCNRLRSDTIDHITIAAAARYGVTLTPKPSARTTAPTHAPDGQHCTQCSGTHNPQAGVTFVTGRKWWVA
jgi:hypothetical protein